MHCFSCWKKEQNSLPGVVLAECDFGAGEMVEVTAVLALGIFSNCSLIFFLAST